MRFRTPNGAGRRRDHHRDGNETQTRERNLQRRLLGQVHAGQRYDDRRKTRGVKEVEIRAARGKVRVGLARLAAVEKGYGNVRGERGGCKHTRHDRENIKRQRNEPNTCALKKVWKIRQSKQQQT